MAALTYIDKGATYDRIGDAVVMTLHSNGEKFPFIMSLGTFTAMAAGCMREVRDRQAEITARTSDSVIAFPKRSKRKGKA